MLPNDTSRNWQMSRSESSSLEPEVVVVVRHTYVFLIDAEAMKTIVTVMSWMVLRIG